MRKNKDNWYTKKVCKVSKDLTALISRPHLKVQDH